MQHWTQLLYLIIPRGKKGNSKLLHKWLDPAKASTTLKADFLSDEITRFKGSGSTSSSTQRSPLTAIEIALPWTSEIIYIFICNYCHVLLLPLLNNWTWQQQCENLLSWKAGYMCHWKENGKKRSLGNVFKKGRKVFFTRKIELLPRNDFKKGEKYLSAAAIKERSELRNEQVASRCSCEVRSS